MLNAITNNKFCSVIKSPISYFIAWIETNIAWNDISSKMAKYYEIKFVIIVWLLIKHYMNHYHTILHQNDDKSYIHITLTKHI